MNKEPIIIGGCGRSGTTLLRVMLDSHSNIACGPESELLLYDNLPPAEDDYWKVLSLKFEMKLNQVLNLRAQNSSSRKFADAFFSEYCRQKNKTIWAEKTPRNIKRAQFIWNLFPKGRIIHVIRDGRDVISSLMTHPRYKVVGNKLEPTGIHRDIEPCIQRWIIDVSDGLMLRGDKRYYEIRYEDLISNTEKTLQNLCAFLEIKFDPIMLYYHKIKDGSRNIGRFPQNPEATQSLYSNAVGKWKKHFTDEDLEQVMEQAGPMLKKLGYV